MATFEPGDLRGNSSAFSDLVKQLCIENGSNLDNFKQAVQATKWDLKQTQYLDPKNPYSLNVWKGADAQISHGKLAGDDILVCNVAVADGAVDKSFVEKRLSQFAMAPRTRSEWRWRQGSREFVMDFAEGPDAATRFQVNVEIWRVPWWRRLLG